MEIAMKFNVFQCVLDPDYFVVTDTKHAGDVTGDVCPRGGELKKIGEFDEMGDARLAFNEDLARASIVDHGWYIFEARSFRPEGQPPMTMPM
jgi:hypothetical protein